MSRIRQALGLERRSYENPAVPLSSKVLLNRLGYARETDAGVDVSEASALTFSAVFACVQVLARGVGLLPCSWYERTADGGRREATEHPAHRILQVQPNPESTPVVFKETLQGHVGLGGNGYARILHDGAGRVREVWQLDPGATSAERTIQRQELRYLTTWRQQASTVLEPEEVLHVPGLGFDGVTGYSPVGIMRQAIGVGLAAEQFTARLFKNGAWLSGVFEHPKALGDGAFSHLEASLHDNHAGALNAWQPLILEEGMTWKQATMPSEDAVFLTLRKFQRREVAAIYQVPPHMIADLEGGASFASVEQMTLDFVMFTLGIWLVKWEQELTRKLGGGAGFYAEFNLDALLRGVMKERYEAYAKGREAGFLNVDEIRARESLPPLPDGRGQVYLQPLNMAASGSQPNGDGRTATPPAPPPRNARAAIAAVHRALLVDGCTRLVRLEVDRAKRAAGKAPAAFRAWAATFYVEQVERGLGMLELAARTVAVAGNAGEDGHRVHAAAKRALVAHLQASGRERAKELAGAHEAGKLAELCQAWQLVRPESMADDLLHGIVGAVQQLPT